jgi:hypothetical protein
VLIFDVSSLQGKVFALSQALHWASKTYEAFSVGNKK